MNEDQKINHEHIQLAGEKIQSTVRFIFFQIMTSALGMVFFFNSKSVGVLLFFTLISIILIIASLVSLNSAGFNLIASVSYSNSSAKSYTNSSAMDREGIDPTTGEKVYFESVYFPNGNIMVKKSFNKEGVKHGVWEYYLENGDLDYKELFQNGSRVQNIK
jgi:hypothetical protein